MKKKIISIALVLIGVILVTWFLFSRKKSVEIQNVSKEAEAVSEKQDNTKENAISENETENETAQEIKKAKEVVADSSGNSAEEEKTIDSKVGAPKITSRLVSWGFEKASGRKIDTIIIHSSWNAVGSDPHNLDDIINKEYRPYGVSPHYIISRSGSIYQLVKDQNIAYHAGESQTPDGRKGVNNFSLGIEIVETDKESPTAEQYASLNALLSYLKGIYQIKYVLGHSEIAPGRKTDPWNFSWKKLGR